MNPARPVQRIAIAAVVVANGVCFSSPAPAQARDEGAASSMRPAAVPALTDLRLNAGAGVANGQTLSGGPAIALLTTYRYAFVEGGLLLEAGSELFGGSYGLVAGAFGPVWQSAQGSRLELLGIAGRSGYSGVGCGLFCDGGGASADLPFAGARAGVSYVVKSSKRAHLELGASFSMGSDLERKHVEYTTYGGFLDDGRPDHSNTTLGGRRATALFVIGTSVDLGG